MALVIGSLLAVGAIAEWAGVPDDRAPRENLVYIYNRELAVWLSADDEAATQGAEPVPPLHGSASLDPVEEDEPDDAASPFSANISRVSNESDTLPSVPPALRAVKVTNRYAVGGTHRATAVFAGAFRSRPAQGVLIVLHENRDSGTSTSSTHLAPLGFGSLKLTGFQGTLLSLTGATGATGSFDLIRSRFTRNR